MIAGPVESSPLFLESNDGREKSPPHKAGTAKIAKVPEEDFPKNETNG
jgi:hypothetical protein